MWQKIQKILDISGGAALGLWTFTILPISAYAVYQDPTQLKAMITGYGIAITAFAINKTAKVIKNDK